MTQPPDTAYAWRPLKLEAVSLRRYQAGATPLIKSRLLPLVSVHWPRTQANCQALALV